MKCGKLLNFLETFKQEPEVTLEELQTYSNTEPDPAEESRIDQVIFVLFYLLILADF